MNELLEKKPDERIWLNVASHTVPEYSFATYRLKKFDLIKVGRVRFKVREIVSPIYLEENARNKTISDQYKIMFPPIEPSSFMSSREELDEVLVDQALNKTGQAMFGGLPTGKSHGLTSPRKQ